MSIIRFLVWDCFEDERLETDRISDEGSLRLDVGYTEFMSLGALPSYLRVITLFYEAASLVPLGTSSMFHQTLNSVSVTPLSLQKIYLVIVLICQILPIRLRLVSHPTVNENINKVDPVDLTPISPFGSYLTLLNYCLICTPTPSFFLLSF